MKHLKQVKKAAVALTVWMSCSFTVLATQHHSWLEATKGDSWDHWLSEFNQIEEQRLGPLALTPGVDEQQLNFAWYSSIETVGQPKVKVSLNEKMSDALEFSGDATTTPSGYLSNKVIITGLKPYQTYYYVYGSEDRWSEVYRYQTQGAEAFSFIVVSDPQIGASSKQIGTNQPEEQQLKAVQNDSYNWNETLRKARQIRKDPSFILCVGDQVQSWQLNEVEFTGFLLSPILKTIPIATTIGNHEAKSEVYSYHFNHPNPTNLGSTEAGGDYFYAYGEALFIVLNTNSSDTMAHEMLIQQATETYPNSRWRFISIHHDLYGSGQHSNDPQMIRLRDTLVPIFETYDIDVVFMGHDHVYSRSKFLKGVSNSPRFRLTNEAYDDYLSGKMPVDREFKAYLASIEDQDVISGEDQIINGSITNPEGILYLALGSASGSKFYELATIKQPFIETRWQEYVPTFTVVDVLAQQLVIHTYRTDTLELIDEKLTIIKE